MREKQHDGVSALTAHNANPRWYVPFKKGQSFIIGNGVLLYRPGTHCRGTADEIGKRERGIDREVQHRCRVAAAGPWNRGGVHHHPLRKLAELEPVVVVVVALTSRVIDVIKTLNNVQIQGGSGPLFAIGDIIVNVMDDLVSLCHLGR